MYKNPPHTHIKKKIILRFLQIIRDISSWRIFLKVFFIVFVDKVSISLRKKKIKVSKENIFCNSKLWASFPFLQDWKAFFCFLISPKFLKYLSFQWNILVLLLDVFLSLIMKENEEKVIKLLICFDTLICFGPNKGVPNIFLWRFLVLENKIQSILYLSKILFFNLKGKKLWRESLIFRLICNWEIVGWQNSRVSIKLFNVYSYLILTY